MRRLERKTRARSGCGTRGSDTRDSADVENHPAEVVLRLVLDVAEPRVEAFRGVLGVDAEGDAADAVATSPFVHRLHQGPPHALAVELLDDRDRELRRVLVHEALAVLGHG